jgi:hypothetical protein
MRRAALAMAAGALLALALGWLAAPWVTRWLNAPETTVGQTAPAGESAPGRRIRATLFYVSEDGEHLIGVAREIPYAETTAEQARRIVEAQLDAAPAPYAQAVPAGTKVRTVFLTDRAEAFVDLSPEISAAHTGGSLDELFTVYAIVNAVTVNLPAITRVQILVGGQEVDSLAGHVDLRRPLPQNLTWVARPDAGEQAPAGEAPAASAPVSGG